MNKQTKWKLVHKIPSFKFWTCQKPPQIWSCETNFPERGWPLDGSRLCSARVYSSLVPALSDAIPGPSSQCPCTVFPPRFLSSLASSFWLLHLSLLTNDNWSEHLVGVFTNFCFQKSQGTKTSSSMPPDDLILRLTLRRDRICSAQTRKAASLPLKFSTTDGQSLLTFKKTSSPRSLMQGLLYIRQVFYCWDSSPASS